MGSERWRVGAAEQLSLLLLTFALCLRVSSQSILAYEFRRRSSYHDYKMETSTTYIRLRIIDFEQSAPFMALVKILFQCRTLLFTLLVRQLVRNSINKSCFTEFVPMSGIDPSLFKATI